MNEPHSAQDLEASYRCVLEALRSRFARPGDLIDALRDEMSKISGKPKMTYNIDRLSAQYRGWVGQQAKLPVDDYAREALCILVDAYVPLESQYGCSDLNMREIIARLKAERHANQNAGRLRTEAGERLFERGHLLLPPSRVSDLETTRLSLGSWAFENGLPPYCTRDLDDQILSAIETTQRDLLCLVGPPKAGKTRSLIENLRNSVRGMASVFWLTPSAESVRQFLKEFTVEDSENRIIVVDDFQRVSFDSESGLSARQFAELRMRGFVVLVLHDSTLSRWKHSLYDRGESAGYSPAGEIVELIETFCINVPAVFTDDEVAKAQAVFPQSDAASAKNLRHLPSWLASVDFLNAKADVYNSSQGHRRAFFRALLSARILFPRGITLQTLETVARKELIRENPNAIWSQVLWEESLNDLVTGVTTESPHAIFARVGDGSEDFILMDAIWEKFRPESWAPLPLEGLDLDIKEAEKSTYIGGFFEATLYYLDIQIAEGNVRAGTNAGIIAYELGRVSEALAYCEPGVAAEDSDAMNQFAFIQNEHGDKNLALDIWTKAAAAGHPIACYNLGAESVKLGDLVEAERWYRLSAEGDYGPAVIEVAKFEFDRGAFASAEKEFQRALDKGIPEAYSGLASIARKTAPYSHDALLLYVQGAENGDLNSMLKLSHYFSDIGELNLSDMWLIKAAAAGATEALRRLRKRSIDRNDFGAALRWAELEVTAGDPNAFIDMAEVKYFQRDFHEAEEWLKKAHEIGDEFAEGNIAVVRLAQGMEDAALDIWERRAGEGDVSALFHLGSVAHFQGDEVRAENLWRSAAEAGSIDACVELGLRATGRGDAQSAIEWLSRGTSIGSPGNKAYFELGVLLRDQGMPMTALYLLESAAVSGNLAAQNEIGILFETGGSRDLAKAAYKRASQARQTYAMFNLGRMCQEDGDDEEAVHWYSKSGATGHALAWVKAGYLLEHLGQVDRAQHAWEEALKLSDFSIANSLACLLENSGKTIEARDLFEIGAKNGDPYAWANLGRLALIDGNQSLAIRHFKKSASLGFILAKTMVGEVMRDMGDMVSARNWWQEAALAGEETAQGYLIQYELAISKPKLEPERRPDVENVGTAVIRGGGVLPSPAEARHSERQNRKKRTPNRP